MFASMENLVHLNLTQTEWKVMILIIDRMDFENYVQLSQKYIGEELEIDKSACSKSIKRLITLSLIRVSVTEGGIRRLQVAPWLCFKGSEKVRTRLLKQISREEINDASESFFAEK